MDALAVDFTQSARMIVFWKFVMNEPLMTYHETGVEGRRKFDLYADRLVIHIKQLNYEAEVILSLAGVVAEPDTIRRRHKAFLYGTAAIVFGILGLLNSKKLSEEWIIAVSVSLALGSLFCLYSFRKVKFKSFRKADGVAFFDVGCSGPDVAEFDTFVEALQHQIQLLAAEANLAKQSPVAE